MPENSAHASHEAQSPEGALSQLWFTRCPVPTATGLAYRLGWLSDDFARDGISIGTLQDAPSELSRHHYDHDLRALIREGGNMLALGARAQGADTRLIGLTWIDEWQTILVRPDSGIRSPEQLKGKRLALPAWAENPIPEHVRGTSIARGMSLHGYKGALASAGLTLDDVTLVEVASGRGERRSERARGERRGPHGLWAGLEQLADGRVDAVYVKGASALEDARRSGAVVGIDLDALPRRRDRVNNGTPRPITVHRDLLENHFELVVRFLHQTLRAAEWAAHNLDAVRSILESETWSCSEGVAEAYRNDFHRALHPTLDDERVELFRAQKDFLLRHAFLDRDFDFEAWIDRRPLQAAWELLDQSSPRPAGSLDTVQPAAAL